MAVNNYFTFTDWKQATEVAKCCIASKQASQVIREANLMGRCSDTDNEISFLQSSLMLLNNYTYLGEYNQITDKEALQLIQRIETMCNCEDEEPYEVESPCSIGDICVSGTYAESGGDPVALTPQTVTPDLACTFTFETNVLATEIVYVLQEFEGVWILSSEGNVLDTNTTLNGTYDFVLNTVTYSLVINLGECD